MTMRQIYFAGKNAGYQREKPRFPTLGNWANSQRETRLTYGGIAGQLAWRLLVCVTSYIAAQRDPFDDVRRN